MEFVSMTDTAGQSLPLRGAWIEIMSKQDQYIIAESLPLRGEWIEISLTSKMLIAIGVAPLAGGVD